MAKDTTGVSAYKSEAQNTRQPMGTSATGWRDKTGAVAPAKARAKGGATADGVLGGPAGIRRGAPAHSGHGIVAKLPGPGSEAQPTMANGKILPPTHSQSGNFYAKQVEGRV